MKIVLSVGGWGADGFSDMAMTEEGRRNFAKSCLDAVEKYNLDGIDIDWEYPCSDAAGIGADPRDKENFTALLATLREYLGKDRIVSIAVGASQRCIADTQMDKVAEIVDYVQLMTYDMVDGTLGHDADTALLLVKFLIERLGTGGNALQTCHALHIFLSSELLHSAEFSFIFYSLSLYMSMQEKATKNFRKSDFASYHMLTSKRK